MAVAMVASLAHADCVVRNADGTPISVRVERNPGASRRLMAAGAADRTASLLANWGVTNRVAELRARKRETDRFGRTHIRYRQIYRGIEIDARELIVHEKDGETYEVNGDFLAGLTLDVEPTRPVASGTRVVW